MDKGVDSRKQTGLNVNGNLLRMDKETRPDDLKGPALLALCHERGLHEALANLCYEQGINFGVWKKEDLIRLLEMDDAAKPR